MERPTILTKEETIEIENLLWAIRNGDAIETENANKIAEIMGLDWEDD